ncbi:hypothetical protein BG842_05385 [Haladaptatus sp. W1]|nr:hypothetical protein BG842_05385 [Haladaptatus sp. W1]
MRDKQAMTSSKSHQSPNLMFSGFLIGGSLFTVLLFGAMIGVLTTSLVNQSGIVTRKSTVFALFLMWIGSMCITIGGTLYFTES